MLKFPHQQFRNSMTKMLVSAVNETFSKMTFHLPLTQHQGAVSSRYRTMRTVPLPSRTPSSAWGRCWRPAETRGPGAGSIR